MGWPWRRMALTMIDVIRLVSVKTGAFAFDGAPGWTRAPNRFSPSAPHPRWKSTRTSLTQVACAEWSPAWLKWTAQRSCAANFFLTIHDVILGVTLKTGRAHCMAMDDSLGSSREPRLHRPCSSHLAFLALPWKCTTIFVHSASAEPYRFLCRADAQLQHLRVETQLL